MIPPPAATQVTMLPACHVINNKYMNLFREHIHLPVDDQGLLKALDFPDHRQCLCFRFVHDDHFVATGFHEASRTYSLASCFPCFI